MICPYCNSDNTTCYDTRQLPYYRRRRYRCRNCEKRFTTKEWVEEPMPSTTIDPSRYNFDELTISPEDAAITRAIERAIEAELRRREHDDKRTAKT